MAEKMAKFWKKAKEKAKKAAQDIRDEGKRILQQAEDGVKKVIENRHEIAQDLRDESKRISKQIETAAEDLTDESKRIAKQAEELWGKISSNSKPHTTSDADAPLSNQKESHSTYNEDIHLDHSTSPEGNITSTTTAGETPHGEL